jgi:hypothetical protein
VLRRIYSVLIIVVLGLLIGINVVLYHDLQQLVSDNTQLHDELADIKFLFELTESIKNASITQELVTTHNVSLWSGNGISGISWPTICEIYSTASYATIEIELNLEGYPEEGTLLFELGKYLDLHPWYAVNNTLFLNETQHPETVIYLQETLTNSGTHILQQQLGTYGWYFIRIHQIHTEGSFRIPVTITVKLKQETAYLPFLQLPPIMILSKPQPPPSYEHGEWVQLVAFNGSESNTTKTFHVPYRTFRTRYSYSGGQWARFHYYVYPEDGEGGCRVVHSASTRSGNYIHDGPGAFFIKTFAGGTEEWAITVEAFMPYD